MTSQANGSIDDNRSGGTVTISVNTENRQANIQVVDTGSGIAEDELTKIFERFYRCDRSRTMGGIGLGLGLAKAIAKALGGDIYVESVLDQGSLFTVSLPYG
jgi:two-component system phosphate regulon sensor histidine kinase PhoR